MTKEQVFNEKYKVFYDGKEIPVSETGFLDFSISDPGTKWDRDYVAEMLLIKTDYTLRHKCDICGEWADYSLGCICTDCGKVVCVECSVMYDSDDVCTQCADDRLWGEKTILLWREKDDRKTL
jgi:hypothetical protein